VEEIMPPIIATAMRCMTSEPGSLGYANTKFNEFSVEARRSATFRGASSRARRAGRLRSEGLGGRSAAGSPTSTPTTARRPPPGTTTSPSATCRRARS
jgi:hypothetical protein